MTKKILRVSLLWLLAMGAVQFLYPAVAKVVVESVPLAFVLLMPFGWEAFFQWVLFVGISYWAIIVLGWGGPALYKGAKLLLVAAICIVLLYGALFLFIFARGGL